MRAQWEECWRFETANLAVVFEVTPCEDAPEDHFEFPEDIKAVRSGAVEWFDARVRVLLLPTGNELGKGQELGADYLSCCAYNTVQEFYQMHRKYKTRDYFGDMVREACSAARKSLERVQGVTLRVA